MVHRSTFKSSRKDDADQNSLLSDDASIYSHRALEEKAKTNDEQKQDLTRVMGDMGSLRGRLQGDFKSNYAVSDLESYLDAMLTQATNLGFRLEGEKIELDEATRKMIMHMHASEGRHTTSNSISGTNSTSGGDAPDSAIDMDGPPSPYGGGGYSFSQAQISHGRGSHTTYNSEKQSTVVPEEEDEETSSHSSPRSRRRWRRSSNPDLPIVEIEEFLDELTDLPDGARAPTPPPKASRRNSVKHATTPLANAPRAPEPVTTLPVDAALDGNPSTSTLSPFTAGALPGLSRPASTRSVSEYSTMLVDSEGHAVVPRRVSSLRSLPSGPGSDADARSTVGSLKAISPPVINEHDDSYSHYNPYGMVSATSGFTTTTITGGAAARESIDSAIPPPIKDKRLSTSLSARRLFGRKNSFSSTPGQQTRPASSMSMGVSSRGSQFLHSLNVPSVSSRAPSPSPSRADSVRRTEIRPASSLSGIREQRGGTHVLTALAGPTSEEPNEETTTPSPSEAAPTPTPFVTTISAESVVPMGRKPSVDTTSNTIVTTQSSGSRPPRPSTAVTSNGAASIRSNSSRISSMFRRVSLWRPRTEESSVKEEIDAEPDDIFGVSLKKSMQMAASIVKTHHDGTKSSSRRQFPRCILTSVSFIRDQNGVYAPNIFGGDMGMPLSGSGGPGMMRVAALKEKFSTPPFYGEGMSWDGHDVYDAAELIVLFLQQLPKPLITETVAKRWIVMSKQATLPGSMGLRLDECIDFWDEALLGVRGAARDLFKLLLNLWGDIADAADVNDMTAERLAARLLNPLMHLPAGKYTTDYMLGLAFLVRKRSEYSAMLRGGRKSKAAF